MNWLPLFVAVPLGMAFITPIFAKWWKGSPDILGNITMGFLMAMSLWSLRFARQTSVYFVGGWEPVNGIPIGITMVLDGLTVLILLAINIIGFVSTIYSISYMKHYTDKGKYYTLFLLMIAGLNGVAVSGDLFNMFVFFEIAAIASYALVAFGVEAEELEASFKYQVLGGVASAILLLGIAVFYYLTGTLNLADASRVLADKGGNPAVYFAGVLFLAGFSLKGALMPFHAWLPDAHPSAPAPISAMLSGVVIKVLGVYAICRIFFNVIGTTPALLSVLMVLGTASMVIGVFLALGQWDFKRLLAYHSISQMGYIILGIGLGTPLGILGGLFHLINHTVFKSLLFLNAGSVEYATGTRNLKRLGGLMEKMPVTGNTAMVASFSIAGLPPFNGFWSKIIIVMACIQAGHPVYAFWAILGSLMTLASFLKVLRYAFWGEKKQNWEQLREAPVWMCAAMIVLAVLSTVMGLLLIPFCKAAVLDPAVRVLSDGLSYAVRVLGG
jgi:multicomponent Na+:H+ antiporter subunit D